MLNGKSENGKFKSLHIMGIGGSGASGFAEIARTQGYKVSGCDLSLEGHDPSHLTGVDTLIVSPAIFSLDSSNPEVLAAREKEMPIFTWQEFLGKQLMRGKFIVGVCGTHGKSTTSAMISYVLERADFDPSYLLGAKIIGGESFRVGRGKYFVIEADEFNDNFLNYPCDLAVCVALEFDHPEYFSDFEDYLSSFGRFVGRSKTFVFYQKDPGMQKLTRRLGTGFRPPNPTGLKSSTRRVESVGFREGYVGPLGILGEHNRINAQAAFLAAKILGVSKGDVRGALASFPGVERRMQLIREHPGGKIYSDYGHHPTEIKATIQALRENHPEEHLTLIFQPHMFTRTKALFSDFVEVFRSIPADEVIITDIFQSREKDPGDIKSLDLIKAIKRSCVSYLPKEKIAPYLWKKEGVVVLMGAGDIGELIKKLKIKYQRSRYEKLKVKGN